MRRILNALADVFIILSITAFPVRAKLAGLVDWPWWWIVAVGVVVACAVGMVRGR